MVHDDVVLAKIASVERCLRRVRSVTGGDPERLSDIDVQDIFVLNLERAVQATIDLAVRVVTREGLGVPATLKESFSLLESNGLLEASLAQRLRSMVGFRNIAVHAYQDLNLAVLKAILTEYLTDLEEFCRVVLALPQK